MGCPLNRTRHEQRKERQERRKGDQIPCGRNLSPIDINRIRKGLESVETDSDGQNQMQEQMVGLQSEELCKRESKEIVVLIGAEYRQIEQDIEPQPHPRTTAQAFS